MYETFNAQSKNIGELLSANERAQIVVPRFQRGYSWERKHVEAFWNDIVAFQRERNQKDGPDKYFLGPIVILPESKTTIALLDGQQRLATATILFSVMRDIARSLGTQAAADFARDVQRELIEKEGLGYSLEMGDMDKLYFSQTIQADPPANKKPTLRSHRNIQKARQFLSDALRSKVAGLDPVSALSVLKELRQTVRSDLVLACIPVASERDAFKIFETLSDRGLRLSVPDLLLNYLMRVAKSDDQRKSIRAFWNEMLERMGRRDINRFLRHMWVSKYGDLKSQDLFTALKEHIEQNNIDSLEFTKACSDECETYVQLLDLVPEHLDKAVPVVRSLLRELDFQPALPPLLSSYLSLSRADFEKVARWLLVFATRYSLVANLDSSGLETVFFQLARDIRQRASDPDKARGCMSHIKDTLVKNAPSDDQVKAAVPDLLLSADEARYMVSRLARHMQSKTKEITIDEANLEHVFPRNPSGEWEKPEVLEPYLWHIGNLTMLGERLNKDAANRGFAFKRTHYAKNSELEMARQIAHDYQEWDEVAIRDRASKLAPLVVEIWNFDNPSRV
jgi:hypothetical protein